MGRHYDLTYLQQVFHGNEAMVQQIVELFLEQAPQFSMEMDMCIRQARWSDLHPVAHKLKSSVNMLGMAGLAPLVLEIERKSKFNQDLASLPGLVSDVNSEMELVCQTLSHDLNEVRNADARNNSRLRRA
jgi:HPt (histidine-containing phosphotransfer) domain-containing protein